MLLLALTSRAALSETSCWLRVTSTISMMQQLALVCKFAAACSHLWRCCYLLVLLLTALACDVAATAATCTCLHFCYCLHLSAVLLLLKVICNLAAACTHLQICCCQGWATPEWYPHVYRSTATAAHSYQGCRSEIMHHGGIFRQAHLSLIADVKLLLGGSFKAQDPPFSCLHMQASHQASGF